MREFTHVFWVYTDGIKINHRSGRESSKGSRGTHRAFEREPCGSEWVFWLLGPIDLSSNSGSRRLRDLWQVFVCLFVFNSNRASVLPSGNQGQHRPGQVSSLVPGGGGPPGGSSSFLSSLRKHRSFPGTHTSNDLI